MIETQRLLPETPVRDPGNLLAGLLGSMHLSGVVLFRALFHEPWGLLSPDACRLSRLLPFRAEHVIPFHICAEGGCWLEADRGERVWMEAGDAVLLPYGSSHCLRGREAAPLVPAERMLPPPPWPDVVVLEHGSGGVRTQLICGFLHCDELLFHPLLRHLPAVMHVSPSGDEWLASTIRHTAAEACRTDPGSRAMLPRLAELMFVEILRKHMQSLSADAVGWFAAVNDPMVGIVLASLHAAPAERWDVDRLSRHVGVSRTRLCNRFKHLLGTPPMRYLTQWRLQLAAQRLKSTDVPVKMVADQTGYESEAAFSRAFKRQFGHAPGDWRRRQVLPGSAAASGDSA